MDEFLTKENLVIIFNFLILLVGLWTKIKQAKQEIVIAEVKSKVEKVEIHTNGMLETMRKDVKALGHAEGQAAEKAEQLSKVEELVVAPVIPSGAVVNMKVDTMAVEKIVTPTKIEEQK